MQPPDNKKPLRTRVQEQAPGRMHSLRRRIDQGSGVLSLYKTRYVGFLRQFPERSYRSAEHLQSALPQRGKTLLSAIHWRLSD